MARTKESTALGLDVGTSRVVVARNTEQGYEYESQLNAFVDIPYSKLTEGVLRKENIPFITENSQIVVHGNDSERFADLLNAEVRRPMNKGVLNSSEPDNLKLIEFILTTIAGKASSGQKICFTVPAAPLNAGDDVTYHETSLQQILTRLGYEVKSVSEGLAVVYSELEDSNYTGIGISCGGGLCNVCLSYLSVPVTSFSLPKAGDYIDASAATVTGERANRIRIVKEESFHLNGHFADKIQQVLGVYYDDMIRSLVAGLKESFSTTRTLPKLGRPIPLVLSGGTALPQGFRDRFEKILKESEFPIPVSEIRMAAEPLNTSAKGALVAALSEM